MGDGAEREGASQTSRGSRLLETHLRNEVDKVDGLKDDKILVWGYCAQPTLENHYYYRYVLWNSCLLPQGVPLTRATVHTCCLRGQVAKSERPHSES